MEDFKKDSALSRFGRDKRKREYNSDRAESHPRLRREGADRDSTETRRRSYNPNFTSDNRPKWGEDGERKPFNRDDRGERKPFNRDDRGGERRPFNRDDRGGERRPFNRDDRGGERRPFNRDDRGGERRPFNRDDRGGERRPFNRDDRGGERRPFNRDDNGGERRPFNRDDRGGERRPFNRDDRGGERRPFNRDDRGGERRPFNRDDRGGERRPFNRDDRGGERRPFNRDDRGGERRSFNRDDRGERKPFNRDDRKPFKRYDGGENGADYPKYTDENRPDEMRLNRYIAQSGLCSRREADEFISSGEVTVNGEVVTELGIKVKKSDVVMHNGEIIKGEKRVYILLNKPKGYVTSLDDPHADKTVMDLLSGACSERIYPVGRLDKSSLGVLLVTNDGDLTKELTHPSYQKKKIYQVTLDKDLTRADMEELANGITLEDGEIHADEISYVKENKSEVGIEIHSGRNRIIRRMFEHFGYSVQKLDRVYFAGLTKKNLKRGQWRFLTALEVQRLKSGRYE